MKTRTLEEIMERLMRLDMRGTSVRMRDSFPPGPSRWYVSMDKVLRSGFSGGCGSFFGNGSTPELAAQNLWEQIVECQQTDSFFLRHNCKPNENVPGDGPQVWVRWNDEKDDWEDVIPTSAALAGHGIETDRIRTWLEQRSIDRY